MSGSGQNLICDRFDLFLGFFLICTVKNLKLDRVRASILFHLCDIGPPPDDLKGSYMNVFIIVACIQLFPARMSLPDTINSRKPQPKCCESPKIEKQLQSNQIFIVHNKIYKSLTKT